MLYMIKLDFSCI